MRSRIVVIALMLSNAALPSCFSQGKTHRQESEIAHMTSGERVREYCSEYYHHNLVHREYMDMLFEYIKRDGPKAVPAMTTIISDSDPTSAGDRGRDKDAAASEAEILLGTLDRFFRLRALNEGREAIDALKQEVERMRLAHFDTAPVEGQYSKQTRYEGAVDILEGLQGASDYDRTIQDTMRLKYKIELSEKELQDFSNYLISQDPYYPTWSETEWYEDNEKLNAAGNPAQYNIVKDVGPFYKAYIAFKAKHK